MYYADRIYQINLAIAGIAIGTVVLPQLSKLIEAENNSEIVSIQNKALELSLFLSIPATVALFVASNLIVSALFGYGSFSETSAWASGELLLLGVACVYLRHSGFYIYIFFIYKPWIACIRTSS